VAGPNILPAHAGFPTQTVHADRHQPQKPPLGFDSIRMSHPFGRFNTTLENLDNREQATRMGTVVSKPTSFRRSTAVCQHPASTTRGPHARARGRIQTTERPTCSQGKAFPSPKTHNLNQTPSDGVGRPRSGRSKRRSFSTTTGTPASANAD